MGASMTKRRLKSDQAEPVSPETKDKKGFGVEWTQTLRLDDFLAHFRSKYPPTYKD